MSNNRTIWYISKYPSPASKTSVGSRAFGILKHLSKNNDVVMVHSNSNHLAGRPKINVPYTEEVIDGVKVYQLKGIRYRSATSLKRILSWFEFELRLFLLPKSSMPTPDAVIVSSLSPLTILNGLLLRKRFGAKLIAEIRDIWPLTIIGAGKVKAYHPFALFLSWIEKLTYKHADLIVGTMPNLVEHVRQVTQTTVPVACIPQGLDTSFMEAVNPLPTGYVDKYIPRNKFIVCHAGTLGVSNAVDTLIDAARLLQSYDDIHFLFVGEGYLKEQLKNDTADLPNVTFAPGVPKNQVQAVLAEVDVTYFSTNGAEIWNYGQSLNKVIDYMFAGKPTIASYSGYPSMINEAQSGAFVQVNNAVALKQKILQYYQMSEDDRRAMGKRGKDWVIENRQFSKLAEDYYNLIFGD